MATAGRCFIYIYINKKIWIKKRQLMMGFPSEFDFPMVGQPTIKSTLGMAIEYHLAENQCFQPIKFHRSPLSAVFFSNQQKQCFPIVTEISVCLNWKSEINSNITFIGQLAELPFSPTRIFHSSLIVNNLKLILV